jgi:hypothetical protein
MRKYFVTVKNPESVIYKLIMHKKRKPQSQRVISGYFGFFK